MSPNSLRYKKIFRNKYVLFGILVCIGVIYCYNRLWPLGVLFFYLSIPCLFFNTTANNKVVSIILIPLFWIPEVMEKNKAKVLFTIIVNLTYAFVPVLAFFSLAYWISSKFISVSPSTVCFFSYITIVIFLTLSTCSKYVNYMNNHIIDPMCKCTTDNMKRAIALINCVLLVIFTYYYCFEPENVISRFLGPKIFIGAFATYLTIERLRS